MNPRAALGPIAAVAVKNRYKRVNIIRVDKTFNQIAGPPIGTVPCWNQIFVVLHEFPIADYKFSVIPNLLDICTNAGETWSIIKTCETPILKNNPRAVCLIRWSDCTGFSRSLNFHLCPDGDEIIQRKH